jgi:hypothetical protein
MSPFRNQKDPFAGRFEILYTKDLGDGRKDKRSGHVSLEELAEIFARGLLREHGIRIRIRPIDGDYPDSPPGKKIPSRCIEPGSTFDRMVRSVDTRTPMSAELRAEIAAMGVPV